MSDLPAPLVPLEVNLRDFAFMPLDAARLRDSEIVSKTSGEEFKCAILLWCASWHQEPAGSLPDDDIELSKLAGLGRIPREWLDLRKGALRGFIKCSDGRLYHPVVAEKAREAWKKKLEHADKKEADRIRKANERAALKSDGKKKTAPKRKAGPPAQPDLPGVVAPPVSDGHPTEVQGTGEGNPPDDRQKTDVEEPPEGVFDPRSGITYTHDFDRAWKRYPRRAGNPNKIGAWKKWNACLKKGCTVEEMSSGVDRYAAFIRYQGKENTEFVMMMATFFGPGMHFLEPFAIPPSGNVVQMKAERADDKLTRDIAYARQLFEEEQRGKAS